MATQSFTLTINFSEELQLTAVPDPSVPILASSDITLTNEVSTTDITIENSAGKGRIVIVTAIDDLVAGGRFTIEFDESKYSDTLGNTGSGTYELTIINQEQDANWLTAGGDQCQNFAFDCGDGDTDDPYQISNVCQLQNIDDNDIASLGYTNLLDKDYILIADIDANYTRNWNTGAGFDPIGDNINQSTAHSMATAMLSITSISTALLQFRWV